MIHRHHFNYSLKTTWIIQRGSHQVFIIVTPSPPSCYLPFSDRFLAQQTWERWKPKCGTKFRIEFHTIYNFFSIGNWSICALCICHCESYWKLNLTWITKYSCCESNSWVVRGSCSKQLWMKKRKKICMKGDIINCI